MLRPRLSITITLLIALCAVTAPAAEKTQPLRAKVVGFQIVDDQFDNDAFKFTPFQQLGTTFHVLLTSEGKKIIEIDRGNSAVDVMKDDADGDLLKQEEQKKSDAFSFSMSQSPIGSFPKISKDQKLALLEIHGPRSPSPGAKRIAVVGRLSVKLAAGSDMQTLSDVSLKPGPLAVKGHKIAIKKIDEADDMFGGDEKQLAITFEFPAKTEAALAGIRFVDAAGEEIEQQGSMWSTMGPTTTKTIHLAGKVESATIELTFWKGVEIVELPFKFVESISPGAWAKKREQAAKLSIAPSEDE